jgi:NADPH-dependent curcumin reductase CurA
MNRSVYLNEYVQGTPLASRHFSIREEPLRAIGDGEMLLQTTHLAVDPYMRGCMTGRSDYYLPQFTLDRPVYSVGVARVLESRLAGYTAGEVITGVFDWSDRSIWSMDLADRRPRGSAPHLVPDYLHKPSHVLSVIGLTGLTAYFGILAVARPRPGETLLMSSAAGGVGSVAGQIAKICGCKVIGLTSSQAKRDVLVQELGFDAALDYRSPTLADDVRALIPNGPDIYFDNVGGAVSQTIMSTMRRPARVIECGQISTYDDPDGGWRVDVRPIHGRGLRFEGFTPALFSEFYPGAYAQLAHWANEGKVVVLETEYTGLACASDAMVDLFRSANTGKTVIGLDPANWLASEDGQKPSPSPPSPPTNKKPWSTTSTPSSTNNARTSPDPGGRSM